MPVPEVQKKAPRRSSKTPIKRKSHDVEMDKVIEKEMENMRKSKELQVIEKMQKRKAEKRRKEEEQCRREEAMARRRGEQQELVEKAPIPVIPPKKRKSPDFMNRLKSKQPKVSSEFNYRHDISICSNIRILFRSLLFRESTDS